MCSYTCVHYVNHYKAIKILAVRWVGTRLLMHIFTVTTTSDESLSGNDDKVSAFNLTVLQIFYWTVGKVWKLKKSSLKVHTFKNLPPSYARRNSSTFFPPRFARCNMASTLQICFLRLCIRHTEYSCKNAHVNIMQRQCIISTMSRQC